MKFVNTTAGRLLIAAVIIAATQSIVWRDQRDRSLKAAQAAKFDVTALPLQLGPWSGSPVELDPRLVQAIGSSSLANRTYENTTTGRHASVHLAGFTPSDAGSAHLPPNCFTAAGWRIVSDEWENDGHDRRYRLMIVERDGLRRAVVYWFQLGSDVADGSRDEIRGTLQQMRWRRGRWHAIVKVMIDIPIDISDQDAKAAGDDLGARIYNWVKENS